MLASTRRQLFWLSLFSIAMAQLEATVVVYLRELYYPEGFRFPLVILRDRIAAIEVVREAATVLMLLGVAKLSSRSDPWRQYAAFLFAFAVWDIFYYVGLWAMLRWPGSLLEWDVLFLIPLPWLGPVLAPLLISLVMLASALVILRLRDAERAIPVRPWEWGTVVGCAVGLIVVFCWDAGAVLEGEMPGPFGWLPFAALLGAATLVAVRIGRRAVRE